MVLVLGAAAAQTVGLQGITPALPAMQKALNLSDSQIALVTTAYLLPTFALALPMGAAADRLGRRLVLSASLVVFGASGLAIAFVHSSLIPILGLRLLQGVAVAAILPITITIIGDQLTGRAQVRGQAHRNIALNIGGAISPAIGGALVTAAWYLPFLLPIAAIPLGIVAMFAIPSASHTRASNRVGLREIARWGRNAPYLSLSAANYARHLLAFAIMTYLPVLVVRHGVSAVTAGLALSLAAVLGAVSALAAGWAVSKAAASTLVTACQAAFVLSVIVLGVAPTIIPMFGCVVIYGLADGVLGAVLNALASAAAPAGMRGTFVGVISSVKNLGKFSAPAIIGLLTLLMPLRDVYLVVAGVGAVGLLALRPLARLDTDIKPRSRSEVNISQVENVS